MKLSAVIIARNEEKHIAKCIKSLSFSDEIIVVDNKSTDSTIRIAKELKATVYSHSAENSFSELRNFAVQKAHGEWLLFVDADEEVSPKLSKEIQSLIEKSALNGYAIPRRNILLGHAMHWGGWWPDYVLRLIRKDKLKHWQGNLHEQPKIDGNIGKLKNPLIHTTHESLTEMVDKTNKWSEIEAQLMLDAKHPPMNLVRFFTGAFREFWYRAIVKLGFLDGPIGIIEIIYQTFSRFISYAKLWEMQNNFSKKS